MSSQSVQQAAKDALLGSTKAGALTIIYGLTLNEWVAVATISYMILQSAKLIMDMIDARKSRKGQLDEC
jgi:hypothetical protein